MPNPWDAIVPDAVEKLKAGLGDLWEDAQDLGPFYQEIVEDITRESYLALTTPDPLQRSIHEDFVGRTIRTAGAKAFAQGLRMGTRFLNLGEQVFREVLETGLKVGVEFVKGLLLKVI